MSRIEGLTKNIQQVAELGKRISPANLIYEINRTSSKKEETDTKEKIVSRLLNFIGQQEIWPLLVEGAKIDEGRVISGEDIANDLKELADYPQTYSLKLSGSFKFARGKVGSFFLSRPKEAKAPNPPAIVNFVSYGTLMERYGERKMWQNEKCFDNRQLFANNRHHHEQDPLFNHDVMMADTFGWFIDNLMVQEDYRLFLEDISSFFKSALKVGPLVSKSLEKASETQVETKANAKEAQLLLEKLSNLLSSPNAK